MMPLRPHGGFLPPPVRAVCSNGAWWGGTDKLPSSERFLWYQLSGNQQLVVASIVLLTVLVSHNFQSRPKLLKESTDSRQRVSLPACRLRGLFLRPIQASFFSSWPLWYVPFPHCLCVCTLWVLIKSIFEAPALAGFVSGANLLINTGLKDLRKIT